MCGERERLREFERREKSLRRANGGERVKMAIRSRKGYWRMIGNSIVQRAMTNRYVAEQAFSNMKQQWIAIH